MIVNEKGEWESGSDLEDDGPKFDEESDHDESETHPDKGEYNSFISLRVLSVTTRKEENGQ
jgi:hypothetical protein